MHRGPILMSINPSQPVNRWAVGLVLAFVIGCSPTESPTNTARTASDSRPPDTTATSASKDSHAIQFREHASAIDFSFQNGREAGFFAILESLGGGVGAFDYDLDGQLDLFFPGGGQFLSDGTVVGRSGGLFRQIDRWQFKPASVSSGLVGDRYYSHGIAAADANNDGFTDVLITGFGGLQFYRNMGDGSFVELTSAAGLTDSAWSSSAAWGDLNEDGVLDLYVAHYVNWSPVNNPVCSNATSKERDVCPPKSFEPLDDVVYFGQDDGTFRDATTEAGFHVQAGGGKGLGVVIADLDLDGHLDVYVTNDTVPNFLFHNQGLGHFTDISTMSGTAVNDRGIPDGSMGVDVGDFDLDGLPDLWVSNYERESYALYRNQGHAFFRHVSQMTGVTAVGSKYVGWGSVFFDVDNDGDEDVFVSNGHVIYHSENSPFRQRPLLFENLHGRRFENIAAKAGDWMSSEHPGRGCVSVDLDNDGDLDLAVSQLNEPVSLLENQRAPANHWLRVRLIGTTASRDASRARVVITTSVGRQSRQVKGGSSYGSTQDSRLHFGLGAEGKVLSFEVYWPSGFVQTLAEVAVDQQITLIESKGVTAQ